MPFKPYRYSTTRALFGKLFRRPVSGLGFSQPGSFNSGVLGFAQPGAYNSGSLGSSLSMSNSMMMGMAVGAVAFVIAKKKQLLPK